MASSELVQQLSALDNEALTDVICKFLDARPDVAPAVVNFACPDLTYPPTKALTERRATGVVKSFNPDKGFGFIACPDLHEIFGHDVFLHRSQLAEFPVGATVSFAVLLNNDNKPQAFDLAGAGPSGGGGKGGKMMGKDVWAPPPQSYWDPMAMYGGDGYGGYAPPVKSGHGKGPPVGGGFGGPPVGGGYSAPSAPGGKGKGMSKAMDEDGETIGQFQGTIKSFNEKTGYGFIDCAHLKENGYPGTDVFLHVRYAIGFNVGDEVGFTAFLSRQGKPNAKDLFYPEGPSNGVKRARTGMY